MKKTRKVLVLSPDALCDTRRENFLNQSELCEIMGLSKNSLKLISDYENEIGALNNLECWERLELWLGENNPECLERIENELYNYK